MVAGETISDRRRKVFVGELPNDFLRLAVPIETNPAQASPSHVLNADMMQQQQQAAMMMQQQASFVPPNTRGRLSVSILDANLVKNYGIVRMDPYCRLRVGHAVFETQTKLSGGRNPTWNRTVHAYLPDGVESIYIQIFDERAFTADECVAFAHVILPQAIFNGETIDEYYPLSGQQGEGKEGMMHLVFSFAPLEVQPQTGEAMASPIQQGAPPTAVPVTISDEDITEMSEMFPEIDKEVIRCVLEESRGSKDATVSALLQLGGGAS